MSSAKSSTPSPKRLPPMKPSTSSASDQLTKSEIEQLRQRKKEIGAFGLKAFKDWGKRAG